MQQLFSEVQQRETLRKQIESAAPRDAYSHCSHTETGPIKGLSRPEELDLEASKSTAKFSGRLGSSRQPCHVH